LIKTHHFRSSFPIIDERAFSQLQLEAAPLEITPVDEQTIRGVSPQLSVKDFMSDAAEMSPKQEDEPSYQPEEESIPVDRVDDTPVRRPASVQASAKNSQR